MKNSLFLKLIAVSLALFILTSCGEQTRDQPDSAQDNKSNANYLTDKKFDTDEYLQDYDTKYLYELSILGGAFCETEDAFYFFGYNKDFPSVKAICYYDKASGMSGYLCARPECGHSDKTCNAYVGAFSKALTAYDGKLYWIDVSDYNYGNQSDWSVYCCDLDGFNRKAVSAYRDIEDRGGRGREMNMIHRGYGYSMFIKDEVVDAETSYSFFVTASAFEGDDYYEIINEPCKGTSTNTFAVQPLGKDIYIMEAEYDYSEETGKGTSYISVRCFDTKTRDMEEVFTYTIDAAVSWNGTRIIGEKGIYISVERFIEEDEETGKRIFGHNIVKYDFESEEITIAFDEYLEGYHFLFTDEYIITKPYLTAGEDIVNFTTYDYDFHKLYDVSVNLEMRSELSSYEISHGLTNDFTSLLYSNDKYIFLVNNLSRLMNCPVAYISYDGSESGILWAPEPEEPTEPALPAGKGH